MTAPRLRFLADENCDRKLVAGLATAGHDARHVADSDRGAPDDRILATAAAERRILVTEDKDFGELALRRGQGAIAVMLLRMESAGSSEKLRRVLQVADLLGERLHGSFVVIGPAAHRLRRL
ncbi:MAG: DUF5615 family PIN-like protein [Alphaproteobacteria bacterium]|nr:DUF5615 family PIN-like protein [Alphaproteobacteria bacterium]